MKDKNRKLFHSLLDLVLEKQDDEVHASVDMSVSSLGCTAEVWLMNVDGKKVRTKEYYTSLGDDTWVKTKDGKTEIVREEDVLEALRNA